LHSAGEKNGRLFANKLRNIILELVYRWVVVVNIIANYRVGHCIPHFLTGLRDSI